MMRAGAVLRLVAADRLELAGLDDAQQAGLLLQPERVDLVEQDGAVAGRLELADLGAVGAGERALDVAEEGALDQVGRLGAAGHRQERMVLARRAVVHQPGQVGLAGARLAGQQHGHVVGGGQGDALDHCPGERGRLAQQPAADHFFQSFLAGTQEGVGVGTTLLHQRGQKTGVLRPAQPGDNARLGRIEFGAGT